MTSPLPYFVADNSTVNHLVHMLLTNYNHFDTLIPKDNSSTLTYLIIKLKDYKNKKKLKPKKTNTWEKISQYLFWKH